MTKEEIISIYLELIEDWAIKYDALLEMGRIYPFIDFQKARFTLYQSSTGKNVMHGTVDSDGKIYAYSLHPGRGTLTFNLGNPDYKIILDDWMDTWA